LGSLTAPEPLGAHHQLADFDSGEASLDDWLRRRAMANAASGASVTFVVCEGDRVAAYYALAVGAVDQRAATGKLKRNMPDPIPVMVIGRLAVDRRFQGAGVARGLVKDAIIRCLKVAEHAGVRGLLVHAVSEAAVNFWAALGFSSSPLQERTMMITLSDALAALET
jgi:GNAT superfamily N-acetyltransferase